MLESVPEGMEVIALDPGVTHLGFVRRIGDRYVHCATYDLASFSRNGRQLADRVRSFLDFHRSEFSTAQAVVIERQPHSGGGDTAAQLMYQDLRAQGGMGCSADFAQVFWDDRARL